MKKKLARRALALLLSGVTLWTVATTVNSNSLIAALDAMEQAEFAKHLVKWELGDYFRGGQLPFCAMIALRQSPILLSGHTQIDQTASETISNTEKANNPTKHTETTSQKASPALPASTISDDLEFLDNGAPSETVIPTSRKGYSVIKNVYIKNTSIKTLNKKSLATGNFSAALTDEGPQVLIIHTHGSEAYSMPSGHKYKSSGLYRTTDTRYNVVRIGDEIASVLSRYGISVLHDRVLHDCPSYNAAYGNSMTAIREYMKKYPSLVFILDVHRDAIEDSNGRQYKVVSKEDPHAAQLSLIMGSDYENWQENLKLAIAVQHTITEKSPTLMRPITLRNTSYNQEASVGSMLVEVGTAGNSLDEAIYAGRLFAQGFAETLLAKQQK